MNNDYAAQVRIDLLESYSQTWHQLSSRLAGLTTDEYLWRPVPEAWSVWRDAGGDLVDHVKPDPHPAPVTTIAWRMWHLAIDCLDGYSARLHVGQATSLHGRQWVMDPDEAWTLMAQAWHHFVAFLADGPADNLFKPLGEDWGPYHDDTVLALALHALREVNHHGAEIAVLRDLYAAGAR